MSLHFGTESSKANESALSPMHRKRRKLFETYWNYYRGKHKKWIKSPDGTTAPENTILNLSRKVVNSSVDFLFGKEVVFSVDSDPEPTTREDQALVELWADDPFNNFSKMDFLQGVGINGSVFGTPFIRIYPEQNESVRMVNLDPATVDVVWNPNDKDDVMEYHIVWHTGEEWLRDRIFRWDMDNWAISREQFAKKVASDSRSVAWIPLDEPIIWEFSWAPVFHCQNLKNTRDFWGMSDLEDADINDTINFITSNTNKIIKYHSHPKTIGYGIEPNQIEDTAIEGFWTVPNAEARVENLEMQGDLSEARNQQIDLQNMFHQVTSTPDLNPTNVQVGALSGFALRILYGPLMSKTEGKRMRYGNMLSRLNSAMLELSGLSSGIRVHNLWKDPLPESNTEKATIYKELVEAGADTMGAALVAGYSRTEAEMLVAAEE